MKSRRTAYFITHPDVVINPAIPVARWPPSRRGRMRMLRVLENPWVSGVSAIYCSTEQKASGRDGATELETRLLEEFTKEFAHDYAFRVYTKPSVHFISDRATLGSFGADRGGVPQCALQRRLPRRQLRDQG